MDVGYEEMLDIACYPLLCIQVTPLLLTLDLDENDG